MIQLNFLDKKDGKFFEMNDLLTYTTINRSAPSQLKKSRVAAALTSTLGDLNTKISNRLQRF